MFISSRSVLLVLVLALLSGCSAHRAASGSALASDPAATLCDSEEDSSQVLRELGDLQVTAADLDAELLTFSEMYRARYENEKSRSELIDRVLLDKAMFQDALEAGTLDNPVARKWVRMAAKKALVRVLFKDIEAHAASDEAVRAYYEQNKGSYSQPMVRVRHILVKDEALALSIVDQLGAGGDFAVLAEKHSEDRGSRRRGGELRWASKDRLEGPFAEVAFSLAVGEVSPSIETKHGFHIIQVLEKRDWQPIEEARAEIERVLGRDSVRAYRDAVRSELGLTAPTRR